MLSTTFISIALFLGGTALAAPTPADSNLASIQACRAAAKSSLDECACFPGCVATQTEHGYSFTMESTTTPATNESAASTSNLARRGGCSNPRAFVTASNTIINMGSTPPYNLYSSVFESCGQHGCDINPVTKSTILLGANGGLAKSVNAHILPKGGYRDWPDRDAACSLLRESALGDLNVQWRTQGVHCRPGVDCDEAPAIPQYYQRNFYQVEHWNDCGLQAHVEAEIKIDGETASPKACQASTGAINGVIGWLAAEWGWLFGAIQAAC